MNRRNLPFNALRAFEAAARHSSVSGAARELSVTHCAVSHELKQLEPSLGISLFLRTNRGCKITSQGETLLPVCSPGYPNRNQPLKHPYSYYLVYQPDQNSVSGDAFKQWLLPS